jgi:phosphoglycolate phosphatase
VRRSLIAPTAVIFDFDLTLADSRPGFIAGPSYSAEQMRIQRPSDLEIAQAIGTPLELVVPRLLPALSAAEVAEYIRLYRLKADETMASLTTMLPGAVEAVETLGEAGLRMAIVSQKLRHLVHSVLEREHIDGCFDVVLGGQDVPAFKPDPGGIHLAMQRLGAEPDDAIYVGDTVIDAQAAANAGVRFVGVLTGPTTRSDLEAYPSAGLLESVVDLPGFLGL